MGDITPEFIQAVSAYTDVPAEFLTGATTSEIWDRAQSLTDWKYATPAVPPAAAVYVSSPPTYPVTPAQIVNGSGDYLAAWHSGRLAGAGVPAPPPRRDTGNTRHNGP
jgi:hypothetical protein